MVDSSRVVVGRLGSVNRRSLIVFSFLQLASMGDSVSPSPQNLTPPPPRFAMWLTESLTG